MKTVSRMPYTSPARLRWTCLAVFWVWLVASPGALADTYKIVRGTLSDAEGDRREPLAGYLDVLPCQDCGSNSHSRSTFGIDSFLLQSAEATFEPIRPIEFQGLTPPLNLYPGSWIQTMRGRADQLVVHSGGIPVASTEETATFGFFIFNGEGAHRGRFKRRGDEPHLSARLRFEGPVHAYTETWATSDACPFGPPVLLPGDVDSSDSSGSAIIAEGPGSSSGAVTLISGDVQELGNVEFPDFPVLERPDFRPRPGAGPVVLVAEREGAVLSIGEAPNGGVLEEGVGIVRPPYSVIEIPTLADLGISAPDGAEVTVEEGGLLRIESEGTLYLDGFSADFPWLTALEIIAETVIITDSAAENANLGLGVDVSISIGTPSLEADSGGLILLPPISGPIEIEPHCLVLVSRSDPEEVGSFSLLARRLQPVEIDVWPGKQRNRILLGRDRSVKVAVLGSEDLDVRKVKTRTLRFGPDGAPGKLRRSGWRERYRDVNRDGYRDLLVRFDLRRAGVAPGDTTVCLTGELRDGTLIEGCDSVEPRVRPRDRWGRYRH